MKSLLFVALLALSFQSPLAAEEGNWQALFDGKNLDSWRVEPESQADAWTVTENTLQLKNLPDQAGSTLWTKKEYEDFELKFDFKLGEGIVDTGVYVRHSGDQIQIGESGSLKRDMTGSPYISGKGYPVEARKVAELLKPEDWNSMTIQAIGNTYRVWLNGEEVMTYQSDSAKAKGPLGIQLHAKRDMSAFYRNIKIQTINE